MIGSKYTSVLIAKRSSGTLTDVFDMEMIYFVDPKKAEEVTNTAKEMLHEIEKKLYQEMAVPKEAFENTKPKGL